MTHLLMTLQRPPDGPLEAEPVTVDLDPELLTFTLDDGTLIMFNRGELVALLAGELPKAEAA